jgi:hypothetical protein
MLIARNELPYLQHKELLTNNAPHGSACALNVTDSQNVQVHCQKKSNDGIAKNNSEYLLSRTITYCQSDPRRF